MCTAEKMTSLVILPVDLLREKVRGFVKIVKEYELYDYEKNLVNAIVWYIDEIEEEDTRQRKVEYT